MAIVRLDSNSLSRPIAAAYDEQFGLVFGRDSCPVAPDRTPSVQQAFDPSWEDTGVNVAIPAPNEWQPKTPPRIPLAASTYRRRPTTRSARRP